MTPLVEPITEGDLHAYADDQLSPARRIAVEAHLSRNASVAARVMADLRARDELRLALAETRSHARPATTEAARRLERALARDGFLFRFRRIAAVGALVGAGWMAHAQLGPFGVTESVASATPPAYVDAAVMAHRTSVLRAAMHSQLETPEYDPDEIRSATGIVLPRLPPEWRVADVQVFPSKFGPSVGMAISAPELGRLSLFAVRPGEFDVVRPEAIRRADVSAAYWQMGGVAYALTGAAAVGELDRAAERLASSLY